MPADPVAANTATRERRKFIRPGSDTELRVLMELVRKRAVGPWPPANDDTLRILDLLERSIGMTKIADAFTELLDDTKLLRDPDEDGYAGSSISISLDRDEFSVLDIGVRLHEISGEQLAYVLDVAGRYELDVREQGGWLRLSAQLTPTAEELAEAEAATA